MRVVIDESRCQGHTLCAMTAPDLFDIRDHDGHGVVLVDGLLSPSEEAAARAALGSCPERAIRIVDVSHVEIGGDVEQV